MCECGCGSFGVKEAFELPSGQVIAYGVYRGCDDCFQGPGVSIYVYPDKKSEWLEGIKVKKFEQDEYGGFGGLGISVSFFEVQDLIGAAKKMDTEIGEDSYNSLEDWMEENGLQMMQDAMKLFAKRMDDLKKKRR